MFHFASVGMKVARTLKLKSPNCSTSVSASHSVQLYGSGGIASHPGFPKGGEMIPCAPDNDGGPRSPIAQGNVTASKAEAKDFEGLGGVD